MGLRRRLAEARPDAFAADLAMSLNNRALRLSDLGHREEALAASEEAIDRILPMLERAPYVLPDAGLRLAQGYLAICEAVEREPDPARISQLTAVLQAAGMIEPPQEP